jgi:hypothetical protein
MEEKKVKIKHLSARNVAYHLFAPEFLRRKIICMEIAAYRKTYNR